MINNGASKAIPDRASRMSITRLEVSPMGRRDSVPAASRRPIGLTSKRVIDILLALSGIALLAPLLIICYLATVISSPGPALFRHRRVGFGGRYFDCLKFRTMVPDASERLRKLLESDPMAAAEWVASRKLRYD